MQSSRRIVVCRFPRQPCSGHRDANGLVHELELCEAVDDLRNDMHGVPVADEPYSQLVRGTLTVREEPKGALPRLEHLFRGEIRLELRCS